ncbi:NADPH-dependent F420 reductase [Allomuricauda sp. SCSIO 65647]|uniref:NADPH-dependent F420 reductase n=1 Tax=Allomuricauda sp. SCSIO 65647 TaxID=2908843 RepID=UPI001F3028E3|nr:NADPH-dependent F420 reductase [Muricauda sp. SCSIO 65647]UJH67319.1 NADPH-dependent F420 reductase [Muricauda sp. SCSIO 65647]
MKLAFIGIGNVGFAIAHTLQQKGHEITIATNDPNSKSVASALKKNENMTAKSIQDAVAWAEIVFLAVPFGAVEMVLNEIDFEGKTLVDCTNPVGQGISHGLNSEISGSEKIQAWAPSAKVVKAFTIYGYENLQDASFPNYPNKPVMLVAGDDQNAKEQLKPLIEETGYMYKDTGALDQSLHLEHMTLLWVKMVRRDGHHPNFVWSYMER